jgi:hypothetical protein
MMEWWDGSESWRQQWREEENDSLGWRNWMKLGAGQGVW